MQTFLSTTQEHHNATDWLKIVDANPERFGISMEHIKRINRRVNDLLATDDKARVKREQKEIGTEDLE